MYTAVESNLKKLCWEVVEIARTGGKFLLQEAESIRSSDIENKGTDGSKELVSYVDKETEKRLVEDLSDLFSGAGFITEEATTKKGEKEYNWIIDPLDGTTNYLHHLPHYCISIALAKGDDILLGVVHDPNHNEAFYAWKGGGTWCNDNQLKVSPADKIENSIIATGFPYSQLNKSDNHFRILQKFQDMSHGIRRWGAAALDLAYVAVGRYEGYYEFNLKPWDIAAGILLVQEAGGKVSDFSGKKDDLLSGKQLVAAGKVHEAMLQVIGEEWDK